MLEVEEEVDEEEKEEAVDDFGTSSLISILCFFDPADNDSPLFVLASPLSDAIFAGEVLEEVEGLLLLRFVALGFCCLLEDGSRGRRGVDTTGAKL